MAAQPAAPAPRLTSPLHGYWHTHGAGGAPSLSIRGQVQTAGMPTGAMLTALAETSHLPEASVRGIASFYTDLRHPARAVRVCHGTSCHLAGAAALEDGWRAHGRECAGVYCLGYCDRGPVVLTEDGEVRRGGCVDAPGETTQPLPDVRSACPTPIITRRFGKGAAALSVARELGAYAALEAALRQPRAQVLAALDASGERGRGGAGFPTAMKWRTCAESAAPRRYVIANGDEGDPGSFIDRVLMEEDPHAIIEGVLLCAYAVGANEGYVYIRSEYPRAVHIMESAIREAESAGWLGPGLGGSDFAFKLNVFPGMGSYVCGEETALIRSIEGFRGEVQLRPPYPARQGLHGMSTVVNNVETLVNVPFIVREGATAFRALGTAASAGTKALCLNHGFARPGIVEVEFGISLREVIEVLGGGARSGTELTAVIVGGPMGSLVMPKDWDVPLCHGAMAARGLELGHGGLVAVPEDADFRSLLEHWLRFMVEESCGKCVPCRLGSQCAVDALAAHRPAAEVKSRLHEIFTAMELGSLCAFGQAMPAPMRQLIENFGDRIFRA